MTPLCDIGAWLRHAIGGSLTGSSDEEALSCCPALGGIGKSILLAALHRARGRHANCGVSVFVH